MGKVVNTPSQNGGMSEDPIADPFLRLQRDVNAWIDSFSARLEDLPVDSIAKVECWLEKNRDHFPVVLPADVELFDPDEKSIFETGSSTESPQLRLFNISKTDCSSEYNKADIEKGTSPSSQGKPRRKLS